MLLRLLLFTLIFNIFSFANAQSIHQRELEAHNATGLLNAEDYESEYVAPQNAKSNCELTKMVYGWHPYWGGNAYQNYNWDMLSHMSFFSYEVNANNGQALSTHSFASSNAVTAALASGNTKVTLCVTLFSNHATFFSSTVSQQTLITNLINLVSARGAHGVNIDFEGLPLAQKTNFANFMVNLSNQFHSAIPNSEVSTVLYAVDWNNVFDFSIMEPVVDHYIIMGYDYYYPGSSNTGPNDPLYQFSNTYNYTLSRSITNYIEAGCPKNKLVCGLPNYGFDWTTTSSTVPSPTSGTGISRTYALIKNNTSGNYSTANQMWDADSYTTIFSYNNGSDHQAFINDVPGFEKRLEHVLRTDIAGIGIWALGYDDGYNGYWDAIENYLTDCYATPCSGTLHDFGGPSKNYYNYEDYTWTISPPGAMSIDISFSQFNVESNYDYLYIYDGANTSAPQIAGSPFTGNSLPPNFTSTSGALTFRFTSDVSTIFSGFLGTWSCNTDTQNPSTLIDNSNLWETTDFNVNFIDNDNIAVENQLYLVSDKNAGEWAANTANGFLRDDFDQLNLGTQWNTSSGNWNLNSSALVQIDEANSNTNFNTALNQYDLQLYSWNGNIGGVGNNRRAGLHFYCDDTTQSNRGNSYLVYWRVDNNKCQIYKCSNNSIDLMTDDDCVINGNQNYNFKILYNPLNGKIQAFLDDVLCSEWIDPTPYLVGNSLSFRTGNCTMSLDDFKCFKGRGNNALISIGNPNSDIRYQNENPAMPSASLHSIVKDVADLWSLEEVVLKNIDWTAADSIAIADGSSLDVDTFYTQNALSANWINTNDDNSGILDLEFAIGTALGLQDVLPFASIGNVNGYTENALSLNDDQIYFVTLKIINNAGLERIINSDGQVLNLDEAGISSSSISQLSVYPNPFNDVFFVHSPLEKISSMRMFDLHSKEIEIKISHDQNTYKIALDNEMSSGTYLLVIEKEGEFQSVLLIKE